jgi:DNA-binding LacI/PurR family transcriptional regulator
LEDDGVLKQVHGKGTYLNRDFSTKKQLSGTVAVFLPHLDDLYAYTIDAIGNALTQVGLKMRIESVSWRSSSTAEWDSLPVFEIEDLIGIIRSPSIYPPALIREIEFYKNINTNFVPVVMIDRPLKIQGVSSVGFDDVRGMAMMFDHLWDTMDFRNIYYVYPDMMNQNMRNAERSEGFKQAAEKLGYNYENKFLSAQMLDDDYFEKTLRHIMEQNNDDLAFLCGNDGVAQKIHDTVNNMKISDRRIQIAGFDRSEGTPQANHPFPSAFRSRRLLGKMAAELLCDLMKKPQGDTSTGKNITLDPELVH